MPCLREAWAITLAVSRLTFVLFGFREARPTICGRHAQRQLGLRAKSCPTSKPRVGQRLQPRPRCRLRVARHPDHPASGRMLAPSHPRASGVTRALHLRGRDLLHEPRRAFHPALELGVDRSDRDGHCLGSHRKAQATANRVREARGIK